MITSMQNKTVKELLKLKQNWFDKSSSDQHIEKIII